MEDVTLAHAKEHLEELVARAAQGENVRITLPEGGVVELRRLQSKPAVADAHPVRRPGRWKARLNIPDDKLLEPMSVEELADWYGDNS